MALGIAIERLKLGLPVLRRNDVAQAGQGRDRDPERIPTIWRVIQHVRDRFSCRTCETIAQEPAPFHPIGCGRAGPDLMAEVVFGKFGPVASSSIWPTRRRRPSPSRWSPGSTRSLRSSARSKADRPRGAKPPGPVTPARHRPGGLERIIEVVPNAYIMVDAIDAVVAATAAGGGIGVTDALHAAPYIARGELVPISTEFSVEQHKIAAL